jgi:hypothetical protein
MIKIKQNPNVYEHLEQSLKTTYAQRLQCLEDMRVFFEKFRAAKWIYPSKNKRKKK